MPTFLDNGKFVGMEMYTRYVTGPLGYPTAADFEQDLRVSHRLELEAWRSRPLHIRGREKLWSAFGEVF